MIKNNLNIGFVLDDGLDKPGGVQQYILGLGGWLASKGHEVHYLVGETHRRDINNVHVLAKNIKVAFSGNKLSIPMMGSEKAIRRTIGQNDFDVLHVQVPYHPLMGGRIISRARRDTAIVGTFHIMPYSWLASAGSSILGLLMRYQVKYFDRFIAVSEPAKGFAKAKYGIESSVVPNFVDTSKFKPNQKSSKDGHLRVIFLGRLVERKGCRQLLESLARAKDKSMLERNITVDICSDGPQRLELEKYCRDKGLDEVIFRGEISEEEKMRLYGRADIAVFPSISGESFGIVLLEAMAAGCAVIAGDNPGYRSVLANAPASLINPKDTAGFARQLAQTINDKEYRTKLQAKQQKLLSQFDINEVGERILDGFYQAIRDKIKQKRERA